MAQGYRKIWKQPLAYYFNSGPVTAEKLQVAFYEVLGAMAAAN